MGAQTTSLLEVVTRELLPWWGTTWAPTTTTSGRARMATRRVQVPSSTNILDDSRIDTNGDPAEQALGNIVAEQHIVQHGVTVRRLLDEDGVAGVRGQRLGVGGVRRHSLDLGDQALVEEKLPDVRDGAALERAVGRVHGGVDVGQDVDVVRAAGVVARDERGELQHAVVVADLDAAEGSVVDIGQVRGVAVVVGNNTSVDTLVWEAIVS